MLILLHAFGGSDVVRAFLLRLRSLPFSADVALLGYEPLAIEERERLQEACGGQLLFSSDLPGPSVSDAMRFAREHGYETVIELHADMHDPLSIPSLVSDMDGADIAIAVPSPSGQGWRAFARSVVRNGVDRFSGIVLRLPVRNYGNGLHGYSKRAIAEIARFRDDPPSGSTSVHRIVYLLHAKPGLRVREVAYKEGVYHARTHPLSPWELLKLILAILRIRFPQAVLHLEQVVKFGMTGLAGAVIDISSLTLFVEVAGMDPVVAFFASSFLAICFIFFANKFFTFKGAGHDTTRQLMKFILVYGVAIILNTGLSSLLLWAGLHYLLAKSFAILLVAFFNYFFLHSFVFLREK